jgi:hypothetical protein
MVGHPCVERDHHAFTRPVQALYCPTPTPRLATLGFLRVIRGRFFSNLIVSVRSLLESMAHTHAHSSTVMWDALSSLPPLRRGVKLGWRAVAG